MQQSFTGNAAEGQERNTALVLFDGTCNLCSESVAFIIERDPEKHFRFASMQSRTGRDLVAGLGMPTNRYETMVLIEGGRIYTRSAAALRIAKRLKGLWPLLYAFKAVPRPLRDLGYRVVAKNRFRLFGRSQSCMVPTKDVMDRFLD